MGRPPVGATMGRPPVGATMGRAIRWRPPMGRPQVAPTRKAEPAIRRGDLRSPTHGRRGVRSVGATCGRPALALPCLRKTAPRPASRGNTWSLVPIKHRPHDFGFASARSPIDSSARVRLRAGRDVFRDDLHAEPCISVWRGHGRRDEGERCGATRAERMVADGNHASQRAGCSAGIRGHAEPRARNRVVVRRRRRRRVPGVTARRGDLRSPNSRPYGRAPSHRYYRSMRPPGRTLRAVVGGAFGGLQGGIDQTCECRMRDARRLHLAARLL